MSATATSEHRRSALPFWAAGVCVAVIVYVSLQPFTGWSAPAPDMRFFLWQPPFKRWIASDLLLNVLAYVPLGLTLTATWPRRWSMRLRTVATLLFAALLSFALETVQMWLPTRYASLVDMMANVAGALVGAIAGLLLFASGSVLEWGRRNREALVVPGYSGDLKLVLLTVWLLAQINPAIPLFAATFHAGQQAAFEPAVVLVELSQTASALIGIGLFTDLTMRKRWLGGIFLVLVIAAAIALKTLAAQAVLTPVAWEEWLRPGHALGLALGAFALMVLFWLPRRAKSVIAGIALLTGVLVTLLLPDLVAAKAPLSIFSWSYGHLLHLNGLTHSIVLVWPFAATAVLLWRFVLPPSTERSRVDAVPTIVE